MHDFRYALRLLLKNPGFTAVIILTLGLGIGANTAIFSFVNAALLRPLPFPDSDRLVMLFETLKDGSRSTVAYSNARDWNGQSQTLEGVSVFVPQSVNLTGTERPDRVRGGFVSSDFFHLLKVDAFRGRTFAPSEGEPGGPRVAIVQHSLWVNRFGSNLNFIGSSLVLNGEPFTVIGIMPPKFQFPIDEVEVWIPVTYYPNFKVSRDQRNLHAFGRLRSGASLSHAQQELSEIAGRLARAYPAENKDMGIRLQPLQEILVEDIRTALLILMGAVGFILLIASANTANLLLSRNVTRQKELAVRTALGAGRFRLVRQLLTESLVLGICGGMVGILLGAWGADALSTLSPITLPGNPNILDRNVLLFTLFVSIGVGILFGLLPSMQSFRVDLFDSLRGGTRGGGKEHARVRKSFVVTQIALSLILLIGSALLLRSFIQLLHVEPGMKTENLLTMEYRLPRNKYAEEKLQWNFHRQVVEHVRNVPGVLNAAVVRGLPFSGNGGSARFVLTDRPAAPKGQEPIAWFNSVSPEYFKTIGIPLRRGRGFTEQDTLDTPPVVIINQEMASRFYPNGEAIGKHIYFPEFEITATIVGISGNAKQYDLDEEIQPQIYTSYSQNPGIFATLVVRTGVEPMVLADAVKNAIWSIDKDQPVWKIRTVDFLVETNLAPKRFLMWLMGSFAALALLLTILGVYGVISHSVNQRTHDIGVRMALGAERSSILGMILKQGIILTVIGLCLGLAGSWMLTRVMASLLFQVTPTDPITFAGVSILLLLVSLAAIYIPARRATHVDPIVALRYE